MMIKVVLMKPVTVMYLLVVYRRLLLLRLVMLCKFAERGYM